MRAVLPAGAFSVARRLLDHPRRPGRAAARGRSSTPSSPTRFDFGVPTLNSPAELTFDVRLAALDAATRDALLAGARRRPRDAGHPRRRARQRLPDVPALRAGPGCRPRTAACGSSDPAATSCASPASSATSPPGPSRSSRSRTRRPPRRPDADPDRTRTPAPPSTPSPSAPARWSRWRLPRSRIRPADRSRSASPTRTRSRLRPPRGPDRQAGRAPARGPAGQGLPRPGPRLADRRADAAEGAAHGARAPRPDRAELSAAVTDPAATAGPWRAVTPRALGRPRRPSGRRGARCARWPCSGRARSRASRRPSA